MALELSKVTDIKLRLTGAMRYMYKRQLFERGKVYQVREEDGKHLLEQADSFSGVKYFTRVTEEDLKQAKAQSERARKMNEIAKARKAAFDERVIISATEEEPPKPTVKAKQPDKVEPPLEVAEVEDELLFEDEADSQRKDEAEAL